MKFSALTSCLACLMSFAHAELVERKAWEKPSPSDKGDLLQIQERLQALLPASKRALVSIEAADGAGSGVIVSPEGLILTAAHVIGDTGKRMKVRLPNGELASAVSLGGSEISDAGMLRITEDGEWPFVEIAEKGSSKVGDWCYGLGHPGGFDSKRGIVVRLGRVIRKNSETMQTDSRLLGGDSGGPLFDFHGKVIAIHSRISQDPDQNYHVPVESYHTNWDFFENESLLTLERIGEGGFLGVACEENGEGLVIQSVVQGSAAALAGLRPKDLILKVDGERVKNRERLTILISSKDPNDEVAIEFMRGKTLASLKLILGSR